MPNYIKPTFTLTANKNTNTANPGPLSVALSLNATDTLSVDSVTSEVVTIAYTDATDTAVLLINSTLAGTGAAGADGGYIWMKNTTTTGSNLIMIGVHPTGLEDIDDDDDDHRFMSLKPGEFAWFPFDYTQDISVKANAASQTLEYWIFDRA